MEERFRKLYKRFPQLLDTVDEEEELTLADVILAFIRRELNNKD